MNKFEEYKSHLEAIQNLVKTDGENMVRGFFETVFKEHPKLDVVLVYGYTPSFNDGDACTHTQYSIFDGEEINDTVDLYDQFGELEEKLDNLNSKVSRSEANDIECKIDAIDDLLERVYGTGWYIVALRNEDGTIELNDGDYDCGY